MAIGTTVDYSVTGANIIQDMAELLGVVEAGVELDTAQKASCLRTLNMMLKSWQMDEVTITTRKLAYLFPTAGAHEFAVSSAKYVYSYSSTTTSAAAVSGATAVVLTTIGSAATTNRIGVYQSDGTMHWTTIDGAPSGSTVQLAAALTADVDSGATVYFFSATSAERPMEVEDAWLRNYEETDTAIDVVPFRDYMDQATKTTDGSISMIAYDAQHVAANAKFYVWPETSDPRDIVVMMVKRTIFDFDADTENPDFPQEAYLPIVYGLAVLCAPKLGGSPHLQMVMPMATAYYTAYANYSGKPDGNVRFELEVE